MTNGNASQEIYDDVVDTQLTSMRTTLIPLKPDHARVLHLASKDTQFLRGLTYEKPLSMEEAKQDISRLLRKQSRKKAVVRSIACEGVVIGRIGAILRGKKWYLFYWIIPPYQGKGCATCALKTFLPLAPHPLWAVVHEWNMASIALLRQAHFNIMATKMDFLRT